jgi:putative Mg2+ transporter-C (MgtC) family protein
MRLLATFHTFDFLDTLLSLATAFVLGTLIGAERQYRLRTAGLRTHVLVAVGAAAFVDLAMQLRAPMAPCGRSPMWCRASAFSAPASS